MSGATMGDLLPCLTAARVPQVTPADAAKARDVDYEDTDYWNDIDSGLAAVVNVPAAQQESCGWRDER